MATRRERVVLELQDDFSSGMARAAAAAALLNREVSGLNSARVNIDVDHGSLSRAVTQVTELRREIDRLTSSNGSGGGAGGGASGGGGGGGGGIEGMTAGFAAMGGAAAGAASTAGSSINQLTGRLSLATDAILGLAPALVPVGALGAQAIGGLAAAATGAAVAGASAIVAFQGVGEAVEAVAAYQLNPTVEGLEKAREAMALLGPDAQRFVMEFQKFTPVLTEIRNSAAAGWFPGLTESLDHFAEIGPKIEEIFFNVGEAGGFLVEQSAESLASDRWAPFMDFVAREAPTAIGSLTSIMGDLAHGASELFMAMDPGNDAFLGWIEDVAQGFDDWASSSRGQDSVAGFLEYARQNGPAVEELFVSLVGALGAIVAAAAPLAGPVLAGLDAVADMVRLIAESDMATPLLAAVAALRIFNRLQGAAIAGQGRFAAAMTAPVVAAPTASAAAMAMAGRMDPAMQAALTAPRASDVRAAQAAQRAARQRMAIQGGTGVAAMGLLASGAASDIGATNTAMGALLGTMAGPWGAAAGAVAGATMDAVAANDSLTDSLEATSAAISSGDLTAGMDALAQSRRELAEFDAGISQRTGKSVGESLGALKNDIEGWAGDSDIEEGEQELARLEQKALTSQEAIAGLGEAFGMSLGPIDGSARSIEELNGVLEAAKPAMDALGISTEEYLRGAAVDSVAWRDDVMGVAARALQEQDLGAAGMAEAIAEQSRYMDSAQGRADNYTAALGALAREEGTAAERAQMLNDALSAMIDPALNAEEALDAQLATLKEISNLNVKGGFTPKTELGRANRDTTRQYAEDVKTRLATMVEVGRTEEDVARALARSREQFIESGIAAGFSARQMKRRADAIGLTPKLVITTFREAGIGKVDQAVRTLRQGIKDMPEEKRTRFMSEGIPRTIGEVNNLVEKYKLTEQERRALVTLMDNATPGINNIRAGLNSINDKTVYITTVHQTRGRAIVGNADGGTIPKDGGPYGDRYPTLLAPGEEVISNRFGQADRNRALLKAINANRMADGGTVGGRYTRGGVDLRGAGKSLDDFTDSLKKATKATKEQREQALKASRQDFLSYRSQASGQLAGELTGGGLAGFDTGVAANRNDARSMLQALKKAKAKGLSGPLLDLVAASGDLGLAQEMAELTRAGIASRERQYGSAVRSERALGNFASEQKYDTTLAQIARQLRRLGKDVRDGAREGTREGAGGARRDRNRDANTRSRAGR